MTKLNHPAQKYCLIHLFNFFVPFKHSFNLLLLAVVISIDNAVDRTMIVIMVFVINIELITGMHIMIV